jgi:glutaminase
MMSSSDAEKFVEQVTADATLRENLGKELQQDIADAVQKYASQLGLKFTTEELVKAYVAQLASKGLTSADVEDIMSSAATPELLVRYNSNQTPTPYVSYAEGGPRMYAGTPRY